MPMASNTSKQHSVLIREQGPAGRLTPYSVEPTIERQTTFLVSPSPAVNTGGKERRFSSISYIKTEEIGCVGEELYNFWGREAGDESNTIKLHAVHYHGCYGLGSQWNRYTLSSSLNAQNTAYNKCLSKVYEQIKHSEVSLNTSIGEGRETLEMLHGIASVLRSSKYATLWDSTTELIKALKKDPRNVVSSGWLGWHVGWKPLLQDIKHIFDHFTTLQSQPYLDFSATVGCRASDTFHQSKSSAGLLETLDESHRYEIKLKYRITDLPLFNTWQLGLTLRPTLAWELTRLSFVVDYFVNIGNYLELLEASIANNGIVFLEGYQTYTRRSFWLSKYDFQGEVPPYPQSYVTGPTYSRNWCTKTETQKQRAILSSFPRPVAPTFKLPKVGPQLLTTAALLSNLIKVRK